MPFFCSSKATVSKDVPYSWYWNGKPLRSGYKRGEYIREVRTDVREPEPCDYYSEQRYRCHEPSHRCRHVYDHSGVRRFSSRSDRYRQACCYYPPKDSRWCQQERYYEPRCYCSRF
ncbi:hypothetical protein BDV10DRAFT_46743 [Aspergillus recurvatus]